MVGVGRQRIGVQWVGTAGGLDGVAEAVPIIVDVGVVAGTVAIRVQPFRRIQRECVGVVGISIAVIVLVYDVTCPIGIGVSRLAVVVQWVGPALVLVRVGPAVAVVVIVRVVAYTVAVGILPLAVVEREGVVGVVVPVAVVVVVHDIADAVRIGVLGYASRVIRVGSASDFVLVVEAVAVCIEGEYPDGHVVLALARVGVYLNQDCFSSDVGTVGCDCLRAAECRGCIDDVARWIRHQGQCYVEVGLPGIEGDTDRYAVIGRDVHRVLVDWVVGVGSPAGEVVLAYVGDNSSGIVVVVGGITACSRVVLVVGGGGGNVVEHEG